MPISPSEWIHPHLVGASQDLMVPRVLPGITSAQVLERRGVFMNWEDSLKISWPFLFLVKVWVKSMGSQGLHSGFLHSAIPWSPT